MLALLLLAAPAGVTLAAHADGNLAHDPASSTLTDTAGVAATLGFDTLADGVHLGGSYAPAMRLASGVAPSFLNSLHLGADQKLGLLKLSAGLGGTLGEEDFSPLARSPVSDPGAPPPPPIDRLPAHRFLPVATGSASLGFGYSLSSRAQLGASVGASTSGGLGTDAALSLPRANSASVSAQGSWQASRADSLSLGGGQSWSRTQLATGDVQHAAVLSAAAGWKHLFSRAASGTAGIGFGATFNKGQSGALLPTVTASFSYLLPVWRELTFSVGSGAEPVIDPLTGVAYLRGSASSSASVAVQRWLSLSAAVSGARALGGPFARQWAAAGQLAASVAIDPRASIQLGIREAAVRPTAASTSTVLQWSAFAGVGFGLRQGL